jgi:Lycopene cyclase protein
VGRAYGRVCRHRLRDHLLSKCKDNGVMVVVGEVDKIEAEHGSIRTAIRCTDGTTVQARCGTARLEAVAMFQYSQWRSFRHSGMIFR